jgi:hypothetical protein
MDTVTLIRSAIRGLLNAADVELEIKLRAVLRREDDYAVAGKPVCDYDDPSARVALVDALARDAMALLAVLHGRQLGPVLSQAAALVATVVGQDLEQDTDGVFRIARRVAKDRVISTVDPDARHGRKTSARGFDGYKGHVGIDPDSEIITATTVTGGTPATPPWPKTSSSTSLTNNPTGAPTATTTPKLTTRAKTATARAATKPDRRSTAIAPTGAASSRPTWRTTTSTRGARPSSRRHHRAGCSAKAASTSTSAPTPSPALAG